MNTKKLAIVIPAYKETFLESALKSIANQSNKEFNLYIGDDNSPYDLESIIAPYKVRLNITYQKFKENLGKNNLVSQWERCIDMSKDEEWIWLFSDDDEMSHNCVQEFYNYLEATNDQYDLYHFNVHIIDEQSKVIEYPPAFPQELYPIDFFKLKTVGKLKSYVVEYVFRKAKYLEVEKFQKFDLAWGTDDATWIKISNETGIYTIETANVYWRRSNENISPSKDIGVNKRKIDSCINYFHWIRQKFDDYQLDARQINNCFRVMLRVPSLHISFGELLSKLEDYHSRYNEKYLVFLNGVYFFLYQAYKRILFKSK